MNRHRDVENPEEILMKKEEQKESEMQIEKILEAIDTLPAKEKRMILWFLSWKDISEEKFNEIANKLKHLI